MLRNDSNALISVPASMQLGTLTELNYEGAYYLDANDYGLATLSATPPPVLHSETRLDNGITVCGD